MRLQLGQVAMVLVFVVPVAFCAGSDVVHAFSCFLSRFPYTVEVASLADVVGVVRSWL